MTRMPVEMRMQAVTARSSNRHSTVEVGVGALRMTTRTLCLMS